MCNSSASGDCPHADPCLTPTLSLNPLLKFLAMSGCDHIYDSYRDCHTYKATVVS